MTDTAFFILAKLAGVCLQLETWLAIGLAAGLFAAALGRNRLSFGLGLSTLSVFLVVAVFPVGEILLKPLEADYPPVTAPLQVDGIVVLGGLEDSRAAEFWRQAQTNDAAERLSGSAALALKFPNAKLVFSGGSGRLRDALTGPESLAPIAVELFTALGISPERLIWEDKSRNTAENARLSFEMVKPAPAEKWLLVTSAFHMGRALRSFRTAGWQDISPYPVDYRTGRFSSGIGWNFALNLSGLNLAIKEYVGRLVYEYAKK